jgi:hypothetical protein
MPVPTTTPWTAPIQQVNGHGTRRPVFLRQQAADWRPFPEERWLLLHAGPDLVVWLGALHGVDTFQSGIRQAARCQAVDSFTSQGIQAATGASAKTANLIDSGTCIVGSTGAGVATAALNLSAVAAADPSADGLGAVTLSARIECGSTALNNADYLALGGGGTSALAKAFLIESVIDDA